jgi:hypothetical protein
MQAAGGSPRRPQGPCRQLDDRHIDEWPETNMDSALEAWVDEFVHPRFRIQFIALGCEELSDLRTYVTEADLIKIGMAPVKSRKLMASISSIVITPGDAPSCVSFMPASLHLDLS